MLRSCEVGEGCWRRYGGGGRCVCREKAEGRVTGRGSRAPLLLSAASVV